MSCAQQSAPRCDTPQVLPTPAIETRDGYLRFGWAPRTLDFVTFATEDGYASNESLLGAAKSARTDPTDSRRCLDAPHRALPNALWARSQAPKQSEGTCLRAPCRDMRGGRRRRTARLFDKEVGQKQPCPCVCKPTCASLRPQQVRVCACSASRARASTLS